MEVFVVLAIIVVAALVLVCCLICRSRNGEYTVQAWLESASTAQQQSNRSHYSKVMIHSVQFAYSHLQYTGHRISKKELRPTSGLNYKLSTRTNSLRFSF